MAMTLNRPGSQILVCLVHQSLHIMHITSSTIPERFLRTVFFFPNTAQSVIYYSCNFTLIPVYCPIHPYRPSLSFINTVSIHPSSIRPTIVVVAMFLLVMLICYAQTSFTTGRWNHTFMTHPDQFTARMLIVLCLFTYYFQGHEFPKIQNKVSNYIPGEH